MSWCLTRKRLPHKSAFPVGGPALTVERADVLVGFGVVGELHLGGVPFQLALHPNCGDAQHHPFNKWTGDTEVRAGWLAAFAGANPVVIVAGRTAENLLRELVLVHLFH